MYLCVKLRLCHFWNARQIQFVYGLVIVLSAGKDATDDFEDVGHSSSARAMLDEYYVGDIDSSTIPTSVKYTPPKQPYYNQDKTTEFIIKILQFLVPLIILGVAVGIRFYTKESAWRLINGDLIIRIEINESLEEQEAKKIRAFSPLVKFWEQLWYFEFCGCEDDISFSLFPF